MLTHSDVTVPGALEVLEEVKNTGLQYIGCKDIGLDLDQYTRLFGDIGTYGMRSFLEVVTYDEREHFKGLDLARKIGADYLIGGMPKYTKKTLEYLRKNNSGLKYFPYIGEVVDHSCILKGSIDNIVEDGKEAERLGADGINLLLYRYQGDQEALLNEVVDTLELPVIVAGSVKTFAQIEELKRRDVWAFTIGSAVFDKRFVKGNGLNGQITAILDIL